MRLFVALLLAATCAWSVDSVTVLYPQAGDSIPADGLKHFAAETTGAGAVSYVTFTVGGTLASSSTWNTQTSAGLGWSTTPNTALTAGAVSVVARAYDVGNVLLATSPAVAITVSAAATRPYVAVAIAPAASYTSTEIIDVNNTGMVVGNSYTKDINWDWTGSKAFWYNSSSQARVDADHAAIQTALGLGVAVTHTTVHSVNDSGESVGVAITGTVTFQGYYWRRSSAGTFTRLQASGVSLDPILLGDEDRLCITASGGVVGGTASGLASSPPWSWTDLPNYRSHSWTAANVQTNLHASVGTLTGTVTDYVDVAKASSNNKMVGVYVSVVTGNPETVRGWYGSSLSAATALIPIDSSLTGSPQYDGSDINTTGTVVVNAWREIDLGGGNSYEESFLYTWTSGATSLTRVTGLGVNGFAEGGINDDGTVFGRSTLIPNNSSVAFIKPVSSAVRPVIYDVKVSQLTTYSDTLISQVDGVEDMLEASNGTGGAFVAANGSLNVVGGGPSNQRGLILRANQLPTVTLTAPSAGSIVAGTSTTFSATASDADADILTPGLQKVEFYANDGSTSLLMGSDTTSPYSITYAPTIPGSYTIFARAYDLTDGITDSTGVATTVTAPPAGVLSFSVSSSSIGESAGSATITVNRTGGTTGAVSVTYTISNGTATAGSDYTATTGTLSWADGVSTAQTFPVTILSDTAIEGDETITLTLSSPTNFATAGGPATLTITDDDSSVALAANTTAIGESGGNAIITVNRSGGTGGSFNVDYTTTASTALAGSDYTTTAGTLTFAAGVASQTITVPILDDTTVESPASESFTVTISNVVATSGSATLAGINANTVTISDDDTTFAFSSATYSGAENGGAITVTVDRAGNVSGAGTQTVNYATSDGTAAAGSDYTAASGTLTFTGSATTATFTVTPTADTTVEADETVNLTLSAVSNDGTAGSPAVLTITNDDTAVAFSAATYIQAESGVAATITVQRSGLLSGTSTVAYAASNGTATAGSDYTATSGTLTFAASETTKTFTVPSIIDAITEADETVNLALTGPTGAVLGAQTTAVLTIADPQAGLLAFSVSAATVGESAGTATVTVTRTGGTVGAVTVDYATSNGTATAGSDYTATIGTLSWAAGDSTAQTFPVLITADTTVEGDETITLTLSNPTNSAVIGSPATLTITDDDCTVAFASATTAIGESGSNASLTVTRSGGTGNSFTVGYATTAGTATAGSDYTTTTGTLTFAAGVASQTITVPILDDTTVESPASEAFTVTISNVVATSGSATLSGISANTVTISDDDTTFAFSSATYSGAENGGAITVTVDRAGNVSGAGTQTVNYATSDGTATAGSDYTAASGTLTFTGTAPTATFTITPTADTTVEADETVNLALSAVSNDGTITGGSAVLTISNDDTTVEFAAATYAQTEDGVAATITVQRNGLTTGASTVAYASSNGSALAGSDYTATSGTVTFTAGQTTQTFTVPALSDALVEGDESVVLTLSSPTGATLGTQTTTALTIQDNDAPISGVMQFSAATYAIAEGNTGTATVTITVTRSGGSTGAVAVTYATSNGTATAGSDYTADTATLAFADTETSKTFAVTVAGDTTAEADETVTLTLSTPTGGAVLGTQLAAALTITNDDGAVAVPPASSSDGDSGCASGLAVIWLLALAMMGSGFASRRRLG